MPLITLEEAAARLGVSADVIEDWGRRGLVVIQHGASPPAPPADARGRGGEPCVEEEQVAELAESLGWLHLSGEHWDEDEEK